MRFVGYTTMLTYSCAKNVSQFKFILYKYSERIKNLVSLDAIKLCYSVAFKNKSRLFCEQLLLGCIQNNIGWARFLEIKYELRCSTFSFSWRLCFGFLDLAHKYTLLEYWFTIIINILIQRKWKLSFCEF